MRIAGFVLVVLGALACAAPASADAKRRIFVVSSYHPEYLWSQQTQRGLVKAMLDYGYLDTESQGETFTRSNSIESSKAVIRKAWMNTKRHYSPKQLAQATKRITQEIARFKPDLVLLGDDHATNYIGNQLFGSNTPVVFWGVNGLPLKYGLVESMDAPGHNVTGVWQAGYHKESIELLKKLVPEAETFAILSCDSVSTRPKVKQIRALSRAGKLPLKLVEIVQTNSYSEFKSRALELAESVDAFFVLNHDTLTDDDGNHVDMLQVGRWYLTHIHKPEASNEGQFVKEGLLLSANDSGFNQSYTAFEMAYDILEQGLNPGRIRTTTPARGPLMVNRKRARMLGIALEPFNDIIDEFVDEALALQD
ncbi:MAG: ABC transporter substrate binding protein [Pseudomonadota bacterium]